MQVFPNSQLGKEDAYIAATRKGIIQMCATGTQTSALHPAMAMLETPMLFDDLDHARRAMEGKTFDLINEGFTEKSGLRTMACIYECIGSIVTGGRGLRLANTAGVELLSDSNFTIAVLIVMIIAIWIILTYTKFSYDFRAVQGNQKIAREAGVNVFKNVFICYVLAGILVVIGGVLETAFGGSMATLPVIMVFRKKHRIHLRIV